MNKQTPAPVRQDISKIIVIGVLSRSDMNQIHTSKLPFENKTPEQVEESYGLNILPTHDDCKVHRYRKFGVKDDCGHMIVGYRCECGRVLD